MNELDVKISIQLFDGRLCAISIVRNVQILILSDVKLANQQMSVMMAVFDRLATHGMRKNFSNLDF